MKNPLILLASLALASCASPKAVVVEEAPLKQQPAVTTAATEKKPPALANDGLRLPDMLALPEDNQLRSTAPITKDGNATIITSPPSD